jgi:biotin carboxyl carrier protein
VGGAAIDVFDSEPPAKDHAFMRLADKVLLTPHLGASTIEAQSAVSVDAVQELLLYLRGQGIEGAVNAGGIDLNLSPAEAAYADLARRMGIILAAILENGFDSITLRTNGELPKRIAPTLQRLAVIELLKGFISEPLNVVNVMRQAEQRGITIRHESLGQAVQRAMQQSSELEIREGEESVRISRQAVVTPYAAPAAVAAPIAPPAGVPPPIPASEPRGHHIKSPMVGTYYGSASPNSYCSRIFSEGDL